MKISQITFTNKQPAKVFEYVDDGILGYTDSITNNFIKTLRHSIYHYINPYYYEPMLIKPLSKEKAEELVELLMPKEEYRKGIQIWLDKFNEYKSGKIPYNNDVQYSEEMLRHYGVI